jgi:hypothetical protein
VVALVNIITVASTVTTILSLIFFLLYPLSSSVDTDFQLLLPPLGLIVSQNSFFRLNVGTYQGVWVQ